MSLKFRRIFDAVKIARLREISSSFVQRFISCHVHKLSVLFRQWVIVIPFADDTVSRRILASDQLVSCFQ